jgi:hypothetical protein
MLEEESESFKNILSTMQVLFNFILKASGHDITHKLSQLKLKHLNFNQDSSNVIKTLTLENELFRCQDSFNDSL